MSTVRKFLILSALTGALAVPASAAAATPTPAWDIQSLAVPTNFEAGDASGAARYQVFVANSGGKVTDPTVASITITDTLPAGIEVKEVGLFAAKGAGTDISKGAACKTETAGETTTVSCEVTDALSPKVEPAKLYPGDALALEIRVGIPSSATSTLVNHVEVEGGGAAAVSAQSENRVSSEDPPAGFEEYKAGWTGVDGLPSTGADSHPYQYTTAFGVNVVKGPASSSAAFIPAGGDLREIEVALPPGLAGNPTSIERCNAQQFNTFHNVFLPLRESEAHLNQCPLSSVVGVAVLQQLEGDRSGARLPIYNLVPPKGMPAQLGFQILGLPNYINTRLRSESDYGITAYLQNVTEAKRVTAARISIWGTPWDASHDANRGQCIESWELCPVPGTPRPFLRLPSSCANPLLTTMSFTTWAQPPASAAAGDEEAAPVNCAAPDFSPAIEARPTTNVADSPTGLHFKLALPQAAHEDPEGLGEADLRDASVTLPPGLVVNPASADGLAACSNAEVGLASAPGASPIRFSTTPAQCPNASKVGTVVAKVPALDDPITGSAYLAKQFDNPFNSLLALYIVLEDEQSGVTVKLAGKVTPDPVTGQLTTTVSESPQQPVESFEFDFFEGPRAPLRTPATCGTHTTTTRMTPWTAPEGRDATPSDSFAISAGPAGPCPSGALDPKLSAGLARPTAATYSPFSLRLSRPDASEELSAIEASPPAGVVAKLAGVPYCPESSIAQASGRSAPGQGALEASSPSCPSASQIGTTTAGAGAGPAPYFTGGKVYLAGPYKGALLSMVAIVPAVAGPFDLGTIVNRIALRIDPETAQVTAQSDPLPRILFGIPLDVRDIRVNLDRAGFTLSGTSCEPKQVTAKVTGVGGSSKTVSDRFQLGGCAALGFKPALSLKLSGGTKRSAHPSLKAILTYPQGSNYANTASASVALPHSEFLDQAHIRTICTRVQFAANACPKGSIYGKAKAITPLLDKPLEGPVYLRSSSNPLPDLVMSLHGQIDVAAVGRIDSHNGGIRTSFEAVPDAPLTKVILQMRGGKKGLLVNSRNICKHVNRADARFGAHNGKTYDFRPILKDSCKKVGKPVKPQKHGR
jgi:hypothetical protein